MRTQDFSVAPPMGQAAAQFVSASRYRSVFVMAQFYLRWRPMERLLHAAPGFSGIRWWYRFPRTLGMQVFFTDRAALLRFARSPEHAACMRWLTAEGREEAGYIRIYEAAPGGYTSGEWRAEPERERTPIERFSPLAGEAHGPAVAEYLR